ncbi:hypothetical protein [Diaphorobacter sp. J5-51]|uniref:hypothetical protein n=1 Tax=Diaphorobacter sp. J5-51 TaxID=680496 RepID=UPI000642940A|nr:hypothetical protein [Diaphorobacter sp. J5-51]KLR59002.1 hypothetical protein OX89_04250 [Diaphorobacter sp. J5-51]
MDTLAFKTTLNNDHEAEVTWRWYQGKTKNPLGGSIVVTDLSELSGDLRAVAELRAINYLLQERQVHGVGRLGSGVAIQVSDGAIRKALLKGALKAKGSGKTAKHRVAQAAEFMGTKFFCASVSVEQRWRDVEYKAFENCTISMRAGEPRAVLPCALLGEHVAITRHGLFRQVGRIDQHLSQWQEDDLTNVPDARFEAGWQWFKRVLSSKNTLELLTRNALTDRQAQKYGRNSRYLLFPDSQVPAVLVVSKDESGWALVTVLREKQVNFLDRPAYMVGQRLVNAHVHERTKAMRN